jgi:osmotically-inducible protein OsmY
VEFPEDYEPPSDKEIKENLKSIITTNPDLDIDDFNLSVSEGVVILSGAVDAFWKREKATELSCVIPGVVGFENKIAVAPSGQAQDKEIAKSIVSAINRNRFININDINVSVNDQVVYLTGCVLDYRALEYLSNIASYTTGVKDIKNNVEIIAK